MKVEYGKDINRINSIKDELKELNVKRVNAFIENNVERVAIITEQINKLNQELDTL